MYDILIIGAGIVGCSAAKELSKYDLKVLLLEKGNDICSGASKGNSAVVHAGFDPQPGSNKAKYNVAGNMMYDDICFELQVPFIRNGMIVLAKSDEEMKEIYELKSRGDSNKVPVEVMNAKELKQIEPNISDKVAGGLWAPTSGMVCPYTLVIAMAENASINGVEVKTECEVKNIKRNDTSWLVETEKEVFDTKLVINCAGVHSGELNNMVSENKIHITPRHGEHLIIDKMYGKYVNTSISQTPIPLPGGGHSKGMAIMPSVDGTVILGCDAKNIEEADDVSTTQEGLTAIVDFFKQQWEYLPIGNVVKRFPMDAVITSFGGVRAHPDNDDFIIGEVEDAKGFINAAGIESPGLTAGPAIGLHLSETATGMLKANKKSDYIYGREIKKPFRNMSDEERVKAIEEDPDYSKIVCRCEQITEAEIKDAIRRPVGARNVHGIKMRTRAGMGRCQSGFCSPRVIEILSQELGVELDHVTLSGEESNILYSKSCRQIKR